MLSKAKKKMYTAYLGVLPVGYYFNGTYACPPNEHKSTERANNLEFNYADNIYDIASAIKDELNIKP